MLIRSDPTSDLEIVTRREIARRSASGCRHDEQVGLVEGAHRLAVGGADKSDRFSIGRDGRSANVAVDRRHLYYRTARNWNGVEVVAVGIVVRFEGTVRGEVNAGAIRRPGDLAFVEITERQLPRLWLVTSSSES